MKTGLVSVSFRKYTPHEILSACQRRSITAIEWGSDVHAPRNNISALKSIVSEQNALGIHTSSYGSYFRVGKDTPDEIYSYIEAARILGTDTLRIWCGDHSYKDYHESEKNELINDCFRLSQIAEQEGIKLCTEFHIGTFTDASTGVLTLQEALNSSNFRTYWQPNQYKSDEENLESARAVAHLTENIHVFNWRGENKYPLKSAEDLWKKYFSFFSKDCYALLEFMPDDRLESLEEEISSLRKILKTEV